MKQVDALQSIKACVACPLPVVAPEIVVGILRRLASCTLVIIDNLRGARLAWALATAALTFI